MKITSSSGIFKTVYHNGSYLMWFEWENYKALRFHIYIYIYFFFFK